MDIPSASGFKGVELPSGFGSSFGSSFGGGGSFDLDKFAQTGDFGYLGMKDSAEAAALSKQLGASGQVLDVHGNVVSLTGPKSGNTSSSSGSSFHASPTEAPPAPGMPNINPLKRQLEEARRKEAIEAAMKEYDALAASTQALGFQAAQNAGDTYAARLMQAGINPLSSGVVTAQAKMPVFQQVADINKEKEATRLDATNRADALASQIAGQIAQIRLGYAQTLADYNARIQGYNIDVSKFNASQDLSAAELAQRQSQFEAQLKLQQAAQAAAAGGGGNTAAGGLEGYIPGAFPGYIPNAGPIIPSVGYPTSNGHNVFMGSMAGSGVLNFGLRR